MAARDSWLRKSGFLIVAGALTLVLLVSALAMRIGITTAQRQQQLVNNSRASLLIAGDLRAALNEAEVGADDYILSDMVTGSLFYQDARARVNRDVSRITTPQGASAETNRDITQVRQLAPTTMADLQSVMRLAETGQVAMASQQLSIGSVSQALRSLRGVIERIQGAEEEVLRHQVTSAADAQTLLFWISVVTGLVDVGALIAILLVLRHTVALREQFAQERARSEAQAHISALEETTRRMRDFLEIASHEIRTPLTSLKIALQMTARALQRVLSEAQGDAGKWGVATGAFVASLSSIVFPLDRALASTDQLERLVTDLVDSTRIEASALEMRLRARDLGEIVDDCVQEQRLYHPGRTITLSRPVDAIIVVADGNRIRQVVTNYLNNAHKFSEETRPIEVTLTTNAQEATVSVRDEGPGIPPAEQSHVWDQFYRAPGIGHVSGSSEGFGLGLYICMSIIQRHGGKLGVESALGQGSTFWFALPLANAPAAHPPSPAEQGDSTLTADSVQRKAASQEP